MKMPEPMIPPITIIVASKRPSRAASPEAFLPRAVDVSALLGFFIQREPFAKLKSVAQQSFGLTLSSLVK